MPKFELGDRVRIKGTVIKSRGPRHLEILSKGGTRFHFAGIEITYEETGRPYGYDGKADENRSSFHYFTEGIVVGRRFMPTGVSRQDYDGWRFYREGTEEVYLVAYKLNRQLAMCRPEQIEKIGYSNGN